MGVYFNNFLFFLANPIQSLQGKASSVAATATRTSPAAPTMTGNAGLSLNSGFANTILMQVVLLGCAFIVIALLA